MTLINMLAKALRLVSALLMLLGLTHCAPFAAMSTTAATTAMPATDARPEQPPAYTGPAQPRPVLTAEFLNQFQQAKQRMRAADYQAALLLLQPLVKAVPEAAGIGYNLAFCYWRLQQPEQARLQLTAVLKHQPDFVEAANLLGVLAREAGNFNLARRYWLDALAQQSDFASAHKNLGFLYELYLGQPEQARYHYQQYQQLTGDPLAEAWLSLLQQQQE